MPRPATERRGIRPAFHSGGWPSLRWRGDFSHHHCRSSESIRPYCQIESDQFTRCIQAEGDLRGEDIGQISTVLPESFGQPEKHEERAVEPDHVGVRDAAEAIANVALRHRGSIPVAAAGSTKIRVNGAQTGFAVSGQTVTEAVASKRSSWTITTALGFPAYAPRTAAT